MDEDKIIEALKKAKGQAPTILNSKNSDEPSCPACSGYNAMLYFAYYDGIESRKCRDCGYIIVNVKVQYNIEED
jgi:Zn ribbon nucleic-acid-binding protein